uniref:N-lysine methyltransferase KMT5A n=1 Tax=Ictidomys tridecemlineatus TaxID=43179 RepID=I3NHW9_ICTTR
MNEQNCWRGQGVGDAKLGELDCPGHKVRCRGQRSGSGQHQEEPEVPDQVHSARTSSCKTKLTEGELQHREREGLAVLQWQLDCPSISANQRQETVKFKPPPISSAGTCPESVCRKSGRWPRPRRGGGEKGGLSQPLRLSRPAAFGETGGGANQGEQLQLTGAVGYSCCNFFRKLGFPGDPGGDRAGPWLEKRVPRHLPEQPSAQKPARTPALRGWRGWACAASAGDVPASKKRSAGNAIRSSLKSEEQKIKDARRGPLAPFPNQKSEAAEPPKTPTSTCDSTNAAIAKQALKKPLKGKQTPRKKAQGKTQQNRKLTDFYPVRRSSRKSKAELQSEERKRIDELIESGKEEGMKIDLIDGKGRGVIATKQFSRGDFVVEYHGDLIEITDAKKREALYAQDPSTGCYMYYFQYLSKTYCVDATRETNRLGRLINHSKCGNCQTKLHDIDGVPHLILIASRDIAAGEELLYDYGDRSRASIEAYPWLKH